MLTAFVFVTLSFLTGRRSEADAVYGSQNQAPARGNFERAKLRVDFWVDCDLASFMPLHQEHLMADLAASDPIDGVISEKGRRAQIAAHRAQRLVLQAG